MLTTDRNREARAIQSPEMSSTSSTSRRKTALPEATMLPKRICCFGFWMSRRAVAAQYHDKVAVSGCSHVYLKGAAHDRTYPH